MNTVNDRTKMILRAAARALTVYGLAVIFSLTTAGIFDFALSGDNDLVYMELILQDRTKSMICALPLVLSYYSVARAYFVDDTAARADFDAAMPFGIRGRLSYTLRRIPFLIHIAVVTLCVVILPLSFGYGSLVKAVFGDAERTPAAEKLVSVVIAVPALLLLSTIAHNSACKQWERRRRSEHYGGNTSDQGKDYLLRQLITVELAHIAAGFMLPVLLPAIIPLFKLPPALYITAASLIAAVIIFLRGVEYLSAYLKRRKFIRKLKYLCTVSSFELSNIKRPYASLFRDKDEPSFTVHARGEIYDCKLIGAARRRSTMVVTPTDAAYRRSFSLRGVKLFDIYKPFDYHFVSVHNKILIALPFPVTAHKSEGGIVSEITTGDRIGDYYLYNSSGFLNALERDCIGR